MRSGNQTTTQIVAVVVVVAYIAMCNGKQKINTIDSGSHAGTVGLHAHTSGQVSGLK